MSTKVKECFKNFIDWYIKGRYHCDQCPYSWEERGIDGDADAGCYIKGDICDTCRLIPPFKNLIGHLKKNKYMYWENRRYDGCREWFEEERRKQEIFNDILLEILKDYEIFCKNNVCEDKHDLVQSVGNELRRKYEEAAHPVVINPLKIKWKELIKETAQTIVYKFKQYFCK